MSLDTDLILAPGTFCWKKESKLDHEIYYRNMIYFIHRGDVKKYKKFNPWLSDYDFYDRSNRPKGIERFFHNATSRSFNKIKPDSNLIELNEITIGVEICFDNCNQQLEKSPLAKNNLVMHLIVADGLSEADFINKKDIIKIKVDRNKNFGTWVMQNNNSQTEKYENNKSISENALEIVDGLWCHQFTNITVQHDNNPIEITSAINNFYDMIRWLERFDANGRLEFAKANTDKITKRFHLVSILEQLDLKDRLEFAKLHTDKISDKYDIIQIIEELDTKDRLEFIKLFATNININIQLADLLEILAVKDRLKFAMENAHSIKNIHDLTKVLDKIQLPDRFDFVKIHLDKVRTDYGFDCVKEKLDSKDSDEFSKLKEKVSTLTSNDNQPY